MPSKDAPDDVSSIVATGDASTLVSEKCLPRQQCSAFLVCLQLLQSWPILLRNPCLLCILPQYPLQNLPARILRDSVNELDTSLQPLVLRQRLTDDLIHILLRQLLAFRPRSPHYVRTRQLAARVIDLDADDCHVYDQGMAQQQAFEFWWSDLKATNFDEFLYGSKWR
jgi:hypothetical protein